MIIAHYLNKLARWYKLKDFEPKTFRILDMKVQESLADCPQGLYLIHLKSADSWFSKAITYLTKGDFSHTTMMLKCKDLLTYMSGDNMAKVRKSLDKYYGTAVNPFDKNGDAYIIISDMIMYGSICCCLSRYATNRMIIQKLPTSEIKDKVITTFLCDQIDKPYDFVGVAGYKAGRVIDDPKDYYCSELCYDACDSVGVKIAKKKDPSPFEIYQYTKDKFKTVFGGTE